MGSILLLISFCFFEHPTNAVSVIINTSTNDEILNKITRQYAYETVLDKIHGLGYSVIDETQDLQQNLKLTVRRWK